jgi:cell division protein ZapA
MEQLTVNILDREYRLSCEPAEREHLMTAVSRVDAQMRAIRDQGKVSGAERIAVLAALNIASEIHAEPATSAEVPVDAATSKNSAVADDEILRRMRSINALLDTALADQERLF